MHPKGTTQEQWYYGFIRDLARDFEILNIFDLKKWWSNDQMSSPVEKFGDFIETILLKLVDRNIVIFIDEVDYILSLDFAGDFFARIRAFFNLRAEKSEYRRLTFTLLGVADPSELISDKSKTPFNIASAISLDGFTTTEALQLSIGLKNKADQPEEVIRNVIYWSGGQPFLTQKICKLIVSYCDYISFGAEQEMISVLIKKYIMMTGRIKIIRGI